jgi:hypothetical protein
LFVALALAFSGTQGNPAQMAAATHDQQLVVQHAPLRDSLIPPGDAKPCVGKPAGDSFFKVIGAVAAGSTGKQASSSAAWSIAAHAIALSFPGQGRGRAPPPPAFA